MRQAYDYWQDQPGSYSRSSPNSAAAAVRPGDRPTDRRTSRLSIERGASRATRASFVFVLTFLPSRIGVSPTDRAAGREPVSFYRAPLGSSLRGRDLQDGRVRNEDIPVRIDRSGPARVVPRRVALYRTRPPPPARASPSRSARSSLGLATSLRPSERQEVRPTPAPRRSPSRVSRPNARFRLSDSEPQLLSPHITIQREHTEGVPASSRRDPFYGLEK